MKMTIFSRVDQLVVLILVLNAQLISNCLSLSSYSSSSSSHVVDESAATIDAAEKLAIDVKPPTIDELSKPSSSSFLKEPDILRDVTEIDDLAEAERQKLLLQVAASSSSAPVDVVAKTQPETPHTHHHEDNQKSPNANVIISRQFLFVFRRFLFLVFF